MKTKKHDKIVVAVSGGFDILHIGHTRLFREARRLGSELVVILNNDNWLVAKKGFVAMPQRQRRELLLSLKWVDRVVITRHKLGDKDPSVCRELKRLKPDIFANGGDRNPGNIPEYALCESLGIEMRFGVGKGGKVQSSSGIAQSIPRGLVFENRPWGKWEKLRFVKRWWVKSITVNPGNRLSLQSHDFRSEFWVCVEGELEAEVDGETFTLHPGDYIYFPERTPHRLSSKNGGVIIEVAYGVEAREDDITRYKDDYGRIL